MRCSEPGVSVVVAIHASRGPGRWAHLWGDPASGVSRACEHAIISNGL